MAFDFHSLQAAMEINSYTLNKSGVDAYGRLMQESLERLGLGCERFPREALGDHLYFTTPVVPGQPRLLLLGHLDTVFPPGTFEGFSEDDTWIYGPGACDMKGGNAIAVQALAAVQAQAGGLANIDVLLVSDEEKGSDDSRSLTRQLATAYSHCMDFEAAGLNHEVVIGRKGIGTFTIDCTGKAAHAGNHYADGHNANLAAARIIEALIGLTDLKQGTTVNPGKIKGGIGANTISPSASIQLELRFTQIEERDRVLAAFDDIVAHRWVPGVTQTLSGNLQREVMAPTEAQQAWLESLNQLLGITLPTESRGGVSDANELAHMGVTTLDGWGPFGDGDHSVNERALKSSFERRLEEVTKILASFNAHALV